MGTVHEKAAAEELWEWRKTVEGRLAEVFVLDQFSRNIYRNQSKVFASDRMSMSLVLAQEALENSLINQLETVQRTFFIYAIYAFGILNHSQRDFNIVQRKRYGNFL